MGQVKPFSRWALVLGLALSSLPLPAAAQDAKVEGEDPNREEALARYKRALELFGEGSYEASLLEFKRAYALAPSYRILYNIALVNVQLNDDVGALDAFEGYLSEGGAELPKARRQEVQKEIERLTPRVAFLNIVVEPAGAEVLIDDVSRGLAPLPERVRVNAGRRRVVAVLGERRAEHVVEVAGGDALNVSLQIAPPEPEVAAPPPPPPPAPPPPSPPPERQVPWLAWGITGALAAGAVTTGVIALGAHSDQSETKATLGSSRAELDDAADKTKTWALVTDVLVAATAVSAGVSLYFTLKAPSSSGEEAGQTTLVVHPKGVSARVTF
jgi:hypothetical protein